MTCSENTFAHTFINSDGRDISNNRRLIIKKSLLIKSGLDRDLNKNLINLFPYLQVLFVYSTTMDDLFTPNLNLNHVTWPHALSRDQDFIFNSSQVPEVARVVGNVINGSHWLAQVKQQLVKHTSINTNILKFFLKFCYMFIVLHQVLWWYEINPAHVGVHTIW